MFPCVFKVMLSEVLQVLRGAGKVGSALVTTQGGQLRLMACNSSLGSGVRAAQDVVDGLVATVMGSNSTVSFTEQYTQNEATVKYNHVFLCCSQRRTCFRTQRVGTTWTLMKQPSGLWSLSSLLRLRNKTRQDQLDQPGGCMQAILSSTSLFPNE